MIGASKSDHAQVSVCVIIPALNEEQSIGKVISTISKSIVREVVVVNNGSTDSTAEVAKQAGATVLFEPRKGYGWACLKGIDYINQHPPDIVIFMDGDFSDYPEEIIHFVHEIEHQQIDLVIGSRVLGTREKGSLTPQQRFGNWLATRLMYLFYGHQFTDLGPFRAIRYPALKSLGMTDKTYGWTIEMQIKALKKGMKCSEIPVNYKRRIGQSKVSGTIKGSVLAGIKILWTVFKYRF
jgi:glycosyltransferase involved in cell wall biosynthesis